MQAGTYIKEFVHGDFGRTQPRYYTKLKMIWLYYQLLMIMEKHQVLQDDYSYHFLYICSFSLGPKFFPIIVNSIYFFL